ncbi:MAG: amino acid ABC transporter permease [Alphaproteobacteria bacterium]
MNFTALRLQFQKFWLLLLIPLFLSGCSVDWGWYVVDPTLPAGLGNLKFLLGGYLYTVLMSFSAIGISLVFGLLVALPAFSKFRIFRYLNVGFVEVFRAIPPLVLILWVYYGLPVVLGINLSIFWAGVIALSLADIPFMAEVYRAGIQSVPEGQSEGAKAIGLNSWQTMWFIVLPQAIRQILPAMGNQFVLILKTSSLVSVIGYSELTRRANELVVVEYRALEIYSVLVLEYLVLILAVSFFVRWLEKHLNRNLAR